MTNDEWSAKLTLNIELETWNLKLGTLKLLNS